MSIVVGQNTWETTAEANAYLEFRIGASAWFSLPDTAAPGTPSKESYLVTAFNWLLSSKEVKLSKKLIDDNVKNAQSEAALFLLQYRDEYEKRQALIAAGVKEFTYSKWREVLGELKLPENIRGMLSDYGAGCAIVNLEEDKYL